MPVFKDIVEIRAAFQAFAAQVSGFLVLHESLREVVGRASGVRARVLTFGPSADADLRVTPVPPSSFVAGGREFKLKVPGFHNALNAAAAAVAFYVIYRGEAANLPAARTAAFCTLAFSQLLFSFGCRSERYTLPQLGLLSNPWLLGAIAASVLFQLAAVTLPFLKPLFKVDTDGFTWQWLMIITLALIPVTFVEVVKLMIAYP